MRLECEVVYTHGTVYATRKFLAPVEAVFCQRAIESAEQDEQNILQRFLEDQRMLGLL